MWYSLSKKHRRELIHWPESGPGYQIVIFTNLNFQRSFHAIVFNGAYLIKFDSYYQDSIESFFVEVIKHGRITDAPLAADDIYISEVISPIKVINKDNPDLNTKSVTCTGKDTFLRKTFFRLDFRFDYQNKRMYPGSFLYKPVEKDLMEYTDFRFEGEMIYPSWLKYSLAHNVVPTLQDSFCENYKGINQNFKYFNRGTRKNTFRRR